MPPNIKNSQHILQKRIPQHSISVLLPLHRKRTPPPPLLINHILPINKERLPRNNDAKSRHARPTTRDVRVRRGDVTRGGLEERGDVVCHCIGEVEEGGARVQDHGLGLVGVGGILGCGCVGIGDGVWGGRGRDGEAVYGDRVEGVGVGGDWGDGDTDEGGGVGDVRDAADGEEATCGGSFGCGAAEGEGEYGWDLMGFEAGGLVSFGFVVSCRVVGLEETTRGLAEGATYSEPATVV